MVKVLLTYLVFINIISFFAMGVDKWKARKNRYRIPEKVLFLLALIGGSIGAICGMYTFRHKTKHWYFKYGMPAILILQCVGCVVLFLKSTADTGILP